MNLTNLRKNNNEGNTACTKGPYLGFRGPGAKHKIRPYNLINKKNKLGSIA
jgi:hypothetical protein